MGDPADRSAENSESAASEVESEHSQSSRRKGAGRRAADRRRPRRASLPAPPGSDTTPEAPVTETRAEGENDERLQRDRPPHWA